MKINVKEFKTALETVKAGIGTGGAFSSPFFTFNKSGIQSQNDYTFIQCPFKTGLSCTVRVDELVKLITKIKMDSVDIETNEKELTIATEKAKAGIPLQENIFEPIETKKAEWVKLPDNFLSGVSFSAPISEVQRELSEFTCIFINTKKSRIEATDRYRISVFNLNAKLKLKPFLIPANIAKQLIPVNPTMASLSIPGWSIFKNDTGVLFGIRLFDGEFPDTEPHIQIMDGVELTLSRNILDVLDKANVFSKQEVLNDSLISITLKKNNMVIRSECERGWYEETTKTRYTGPGVGFQIDPDKLISVLKESNKCTMDSKKLVFSGEGWKYVIALILSGAEKE